MRHFQQYHPTPPSPHHLSTTNWPTHPSARMTDRGATFTGPAATVKWSSYFAKRGTEGRWLFSGRGQSYRDSWLCSLIHSYPRHHKNNSERWHTTLWSIGNPHICPTTSRPSTKMKTSIELIMKNRPYEKTAFISCRCGNIRTGLGSEQEQEKD